MQEQKTSRVYNMHEKCFDMHPHLDNQSSKELLKFETLQLKVKRGIITLTITNSTSVI